MKAEIYTWSTCPFCHRAKVILEKHGIAFEEHVMDGKDAELGELKLKYNHTTVPIVILDGNFVGGSSDLEELARAGKLG